MINHARTLLLGVAGPHTEQLDIPGDIYIPSFTPVTVSSALQDVSSVLFGAKPDYEGRVYRVAQYLGILHSTEYAAYMFKDDARITYDPNALTVIDEGQYGATVVGDTPLTVSGTWDDSGITGRANTKWRVTAVTTTDILVENLSDKLAATYGQYDTKYLIGSPLVCAIGTQPMAAGQVWYIHYKARIKPDLGQVLVSLQNMPSDVLSAVFGPTVRVEPFRTFNNLFKQHYAAPYQLTGLLLGYIYRLEAIRTDA